MNKKMKTIVAAAILMLGTVVAMPADLKNEDGKRYEVKVHDGGTTRNTWIDGNSTVLSICSSCEIEVVGVGKMRVSSSDKLIIKNGKLSK
ncbi:MAG TPA: hypothetical protein PKE66_14640 [Pyrinomonadaceae bacterium]|nr:hypothetical protein [Pyrinomonadaceae bacterium]